MNRPLTAADLSELERLLSRERRGRARRTSTARRRVRRGSGFFVRSLVGMDRAAAKEALARFPERTRRYGANQIEFVNLIVDHLTEHGVMEAARLYESPFTDLTPQGPDALFRATEVDELLRVLRHVRASAEAA